MRRNVDGTALTQTRNNIQENNRLRKRRFGKYTYIFETFISKYTYRLYEGNVPEPQN